MTVATSRPRAAPPRSLRVRQLVQLLRAALREVMAQRAHRPEPDEAQALRGRQRALARLIERHRRP